MRRRAARVILSVVLGVSICILVFPSLLLADLPRDPFLAEYKFLSESSLPDDGSVKEHVDPHSGYLTLTHTDVFLPGNSGLDVRLMRAYKSSIWGSRDSIFSGLIAYDERSPLGIGWSMHMGIVRNPRGVTGQNPGSGLVPNNPVVEMPDGSVHSLYRIPGSSPIQYMSKEFWIFRPASGDSDKWELLLTDGTIYTFESRSHIVGYYTYANLGNNILDSGRLRWDDTVHGEGSINSQLLSFFSGDGRRWVVVLEAYFDESGTHRGAGMVCVAASFAPQVYWSRFERDWSRLLKEHGVSRFHAKDPSCDFLWPNLALLIKKHQIYSDVCSVRPEIYRDHASAQLRSQMDAYGICAYVCALEISNYARIKNLGRVAMVLEAGQPNDKRVTSALNEMIADPDFLIASVSLAKKEEFIQLHVPDFISHICSTGNPWFEILLNSGGIRHISTNKKAFEAFSGDLRRLIAKNKAERRRAKRLEE